MGLKMQQLSSKNENVLDNVQTSERALVIDILKKEKGGGIMLLFREDLPVKVLSVDKCHESCYVELILKKTKWLIKYSYNPTKNKISSHLESLSRNLDLYTSKIENILVIGDLSISIEDDNMENFCQSYNLKSLIKVPTCYKNPDNPRCIDLILTNKPRIFKIRV